jgi:hypothetical protein
MMPVRGKKKRSKQNQKVPLLIRSGKPLEPGFDSIKAGTL